jgi:urease accessory protein
MRRGVARLKADVVYGKTRITELSHRAPSRLHPMQTPGATRVGAAWCAMGEYGGGLLGGDCVDMDVAVGPDATLLLSSQGSTKVFKSRGDGQASRQTLHASVADGGLLVVGFDPVIPFAAAKYEQTQSYGSPLQ